MSGARALLGRAGWPLLVCLLAGCSPGQSRFAWQLASDLNRIGQEDSAALQGRALGPVPVLLPAEGGQVRFDLYRPARGAAQALALAVPGAAELGKGDPRLVEFAKVLAGSGFNVAVPDLEGLKTLRVSPEDIREIRESFRLVASDAELARQGRSGIVAFSYAAGPALLASAEPQIRDQVRFLVLVGGYHDLERVLRFTTTGVHGYGGRREGGAPHPYGKLVFMLAVEDLQEPADREILMRMVDELPRDPQADLGAHAQRLGAGARALYELLMNEEPERFASLLARLDPGMRERLKALSPSAHDLSRLRTRVYLIHGRLDPAIPYTESLFLRDALQAHVPVRLTILETFHHVDLGSGGGFFRRLRDRWRIWWALYHLAWERARAA